jgi:4-amino-4-deoxy-L-arabinose transferase-like glycosyltransferase
MSWIGYITTLVTLISAIGLIVTLFFSKDDIKKTLSGSVDRRMISALAASIAFFFIFSILFVAPIEQLYFDENIYQGIALNILHSGNAEWCQYGTGHLTHCFINEVYHDPAEWTVFIAIAFALFGIGIKTAYALQLLTGGLSIFAIFLLAAVIFDKKKTTITSVIIMALMPPLFIWARTQAVIDLPFMMLSIFAFFFFTMFMKRQNSKTLILFLFSLILVVYSRIEAILMLPIFLILFFTLGRQKIGETIIRRLKVVKKTFAENVTVMSILLVFVIMLFPQVYYINLQLNSGNYGQSFTNQKLFSFTNFRVNARDNALSLIGYYNNTYGFPDIFPWTVTVLAIVGIAFCILKRNYKYKNILLVSLLWFLFYFMFYGFFYAGSARFGVDSRFLLQMTPALVILGAVGVEGIANVVETVLKKKARLKMMVYPIFVIVLVISPFAMYANLVTLKPSQMPQQIQINKPVQFLYQNYNKVPNNCLVFSFTPDVWYELNRSSVQIGYINNPQATFNNYKCFVLDYGYWCTVPPYRDTLCSSILSKYKMKTLVSGNAWGSYNVSLYQIMNYTP